MLTCLRVRQFAIVDEVEVNLGPGLNVVTGETGAGKSILVHALQLVSGGRARPEAIRSGADEAEVEALFDLSDQPEIRARLAELDLPTDELAVRRVVGANGRSRAYLAGRLATAGQLQALAAGLIDISSQHEHHSLADVRGHLAYLDAYARHPDLVDRTHAAWLAAAAAERARRDLVARLADRSEREELTRFQLAEMRRIDPRPGELDALVEESSRLQHAGALADVTRAAADALYEGEGAIAARLSRLAHELDAAARRDPRLSAWVRQIEGARLEIEDAALELGRYARGLVFDPARQAEVDERLHALQRLSRRYGGTLDAVLAARDRLEAELAVFDDVEGAVEEAARTASRAADDALASARALSASRAAAAERLGDAIGAELGSLAMGGARVEVALAPLDGDGLVRDGVVLGPNGIDRAEFLIAPNRGEPPRALRKVASGGELSRSLLAIKRVLAGLGPVGTYVFDEVDTGVGGAVAAAIGAKLGEVGRHHQVLCITHQPQIAAYGDHHLCVAKQVVGDRTVSSIRPLSTEDRVDEIARMLGGAVVTPATRGAALDLLQQSRGHR